MGGDGTGEGLFLRLRATNTPAIMISSTIAALAPPNATKAASTFRKKKSGIGINYILTTQLQFKLNTATTANKTYHYNAIDR